MKGSGTSLQRLHFAEDGVAGAEEVVTGLHETLAEPLLGFFEVVARVVDFFVADFAIEFEDAVVVLEHVMGDREGEGVLGVGVDVHLDDTVAKGFADFFEGGS